MLPTLRRISAPIITLAACGCAKNVVLPATQSVDFDPIAFFQGHSRGEGELRKLFSNPVHISVTSVGRMGTNSLVLDQTIGESGKPLSSRRWTIRRVAPNRYTGTLTDAVGPVTAQVDGSRAYIKYRMRHGLTVEQQLAQQSDGRTVLNRLVVRKFGVRVATLNETIRKE